MKKIIIAVSLSLILLTANGSGTKSWFHVSYVWFYDTDTKHGSGYGSMEVEYESVADKDMIPIQKYAEESLATQKHLDRKYVKCILLCIEKLPIK